MPPSGVYMWRNHSVRCSGTLQCHTRNVGSLPSACSLRVHMLCLAAELPTLDAPGGSVMDSAYARPMDRMPQAPAARARCVE
jgi:hypothetical protein